MMQRLPRALLLEPFDRQKLQPAWGLPSVGVPDALDEGEHLAPL